MSRCPILTNVAREDRSATRLRREYLGQEEETTVHPTIRHLHLVLAGQRGFSSDGHRLSSLYRNTRLVGSWLKSNEGSQTLGFFSAKILKLRNAGGQA